MINAQGPLGDLIRGGASHGAARPAIRFAGHTFSYAEVEQITAAIAAELTARGIRKGDRVGLLCPNTPEFVLTYFGIIKAGAVVVPLNLLLNPKESAFILNDAGARALFYHAAFETAIEELQSLTPDLEMLVTIGGSVPQPTRLQWEEFARSGRPAPALGWQPEKDLAAILYTSGTTGRPKGAMLSHHNLVRNVWSTSQAMHLEPGHERFLVVLPLFHAFAATACMLLPLATGSILVPLPRFDPAQVAATIEAELITLFMGVPSMFVALLRLPAGAEKQLASLKFCVSGGAALPVAVLREFESRFGKKIYEGDGPTECSPVTCVNPIGGRTKPGTVGLPVPDVEMRILDEQGQEVPDGVIGEICVRGPNVMQGYWKLPDDTREAFFAEWFRTGDLGTRDADGYFSILDRRKDMIIINGMNIYPRIIEEVLAACPGVREVAVIGEPHALHGEIPVAYVSLREGADLGPKQLRACCRASLGRHEIPRRFIILPDLPKNAAGKIMKRELRRQGEIERGIDSSKQP